MERLIFSLGLILAGLVFGYSLQYLDRTGRVSLPMPVAPLRKLLQRIGLLFFMPVSFLAAIWIVPFDDLRVVLLPIIGAVALISGGFLGLLFARLRGKEPAQKGVLYCCGSFTNIGSIGALVCYMLLGEAGFALVALYKMFEETIYYTIGFPLARFYSGAAKHSGQPLGKIVLGVFTDPFVCATLTALVAGLTLNLSGVDRPLFFSGLTEWFVPLGTFILIVSIGLGMHFGRIYGHLQDALGISLIKFVCIPLIACTLAWMFGLHQAGDGMMFKVVLILSSMPVAFNALVAASIYDLDLDLANSCWLVSTAGLAIVLPLLYAILAIVG